MGCCALLCDIAANVLGSGMEPIKSPAIDKC